MENGLTLLQERLITTSMDWFILDASLKFAMKDVWKEAEKKKILFLLNTFNKSMTDTKNGWFNLKKN